LGDQSFFVDISGVDRTNFRTGGVVTMHTGPWKESSFDVRILPFDVRDQLDPVNRAAFGRFHWSDDRNIVLCLASNDTCLTSGALVEVDDHAPTMHWAPP